MTTTTKQATPVTGTRALVVAMVAVDALVVLAAVLAAVVAGREAAVAALVGGAVAAVVLFTGTAIVNVVAGLLPAASLLVALLTYTLQVVLLAVVFAALAGTSLGADDTTRAWLAGAVIAVTLAWLVVHLRVSTRARIPVYDLPDGPVATTVAEPRPRGEGGGER